MNRNPISPPTRGYAPPEVWPEPGIPLIAGDDTRSPQEICRCAAVCFGAILIGMILILVAIVAAW